MNREPNVVGARLSLGLKFFEAFVREPMTVGACWPSSAGLSRAVVDSCQFSPGDIVVELGPGTGSFTELLCERLDDRGQLLALEISDTNIATLRERFRAAARFMTPRRTWVVTWAT